MGQNIKITRFRGDTLVLPIGIKTKTTGNPVNLTGAIIKFTLAAVPTSITETTAGVTVDRDDVNGKFIITIPFTVMSTFIARKYLMDVEITYSNGRKDTLFTLELTLAEDVTK